MVKSGKNHGMGKTRIYRIWKTMKARCTYPTNSSYKNYGAKGVIYCDSWEKFLNFYEDMSEGYADNLTLDRIDSKGTYCKENCRWVPRAEQNRNKGDNVIVVYKGEEVGLAEIYHQIESEVPYKLVHSRLSQGWDAETALTKPPRQGNYWRGTRNVNS